MKRSILILALTVITLTLSHAQKDETIFRSHGIHLSGVWGGSTNGLVNIGSDYSLNNGGFLTFEFNKNFLIGWSGYGSGTTLENDMHVDIKGNDLLLGYGLNSYKSLHPFFYLKTGSGTLEVDESKDNVFVVEPSIGAEVNVFRWFRLGLDGGYRFVSQVNTPGLSNGDLSSPFVSLRLKFGWSWGG